MNNVRIGALGPESRALVREVFQTTPPRLAENPCRIGGDLASLITIKTVWLALKISQSRKTIIPEPASEELQVTIKLSACDLLIEGGSRSACFSTAF